MTDGLLYSSNREDVRRLLSLVHCIYSDNKGAIAPILSTAELVKSNVTQSLLIGSVAVR